LENHQKHLSHKEVTHKHVSDVFTTDSGKQAISVCIPVFEEKQFIGILRALIYLDSINDTARKIKAGRKVMPKL